MAIPTIAKDPRVTKKSTGVTTTTKASTLDSNSLSSAQKLVGGNLTTKQTQAVQNYDAKNGAGATATKLANYNLAKDVKGTDLTSKDVSTVKASEGTIGTQATGEKLQAKITKPTTIGATTGTTTDTQTTQAPQTGDVLTAQNIPAEYKAFYDTLSDTEKKQFEAIGENARKAGQDVAKEYANYMRDYDTTKKRIEENQAYTEKQNALSSQMQDIQDNQTLRKAREQVDKLIQTTSYLGSQGMPGVSQSRITGIKDQINEAERTYSELKDLTRLSTSSREAGYEQQAVEYERQLEDLNTKLNDDINIAIQNVRNELLKADSDGKLDTESEIEAFRVKMLQDLDSKITGISDASIQQRQFLIQRYDNIVQEAKLKEANKLIINPEMSQLQGYYMDGNGEPIISATTGQRIQYNQAPIEPIYDTAKGQLITFSQDANGNIVGKYEQVIPLPTFQESTIASFANLVAQGKLGYDDVPENIRNTDTFINSFASSTTPELIKMGENSLYDPVNQRWITPPTEKSSEVMNLQEGDIGGQCGTFARQYVGFTQGLDSVVGKTASDRRKTMTETEPVVGGLAFFEGGNYNKEYGHIEVVKSINADGTMTLVGSNLRNDQKVTERTIPISEAQGFYNNTPLATGGGYSQDRIELLAEISQIQSETEKRKALESAGLSLQDLTKYKADASAGRIPPTEAQKQSALGIISNIQGISELDWNNAVGKFDPTRIIGTQAAEDTRVLIDNLRNSSALNNLGMLKGPMSDKDVDFIKSVSSKLDPVQSNKQFEKNIVEMYNIAAMKAGIPSIKSLSEIPKERILPGVSQSTGEGASIGGQTYQSTTGNTYNLDDYR